MRNLKKILALVLALVMSMSLMATANAAFNDASDIDGTYDEAVQVLNALGVFEGRDGNNFAPKATITRAEVAAIIYRIVTGDTTKRQNDLYSDYNEFDDVPSTHWAAGYIGFCYNGEYIKGYNKTTFGPSDPVTGYQALAMILRAVGYDKNHEFEGSGWEIRTAQIANERQITKNLKDTTLRTPATREVVAEILFRAILVDKVSYTPALGYQKWNTNSIGYDTFGLVGSILGNDVWGRPATEWKLDKAPYDGVATAADTKLIAIPYKADYETTVKVDECDIAYALGLTKNTAMETAWRDGVQVTNATLAAGGDITPLRTNDYVGAQGRLTEAYVMANGTIRLVEINTYLAKVIKVTPSYTDKNGHTTADTIDVTVYNGTKDASGAKTAQTNQNIYGVEATGFAVNDYVLVNVTKPATYNAAVEGIELAEIVAGGALTAYTNIAGLNPATSTVGGTVYNDADKFFEGLRDTTKNWNVALDQYGNAIGLVQATTNYLVIEGVRWIGDSTLYGGSAIANVVLADGTRQENVTIASVGAKAANHNSVAGGVPANGSFDTSYLANSAYYNHILAYSVNADGTYALTMPTHLTNPLDMHAAEIRNGQTIMSGLVGPSGASASNISVTVGINDNTVFLVQKVDGTYETYTGKNNVPGLNATDVCYLMNGNYAALVVVKGVALASNTFDAYVDVNTAWTGRYTNLGYAFTVYKEGTAEPFTVYYGENSLYLDGVFDGVYTFQVNSLGQLVDNAGKVYDETGFNALQAQGKWSAMFDFANIYGDHIANTTSGAGVGVNYLWDRTTVDTNAGGNMYKAANNTNTYYVNDAKYLVAGYNTSGDLVSLRAAEYAEINWSVQHQVLVAYKYAGAVKHAAYVYVLDQGTTAPGVPTISNLNLTPTAVVAAWVVNGCDFDVTATHTGGTESWSVTDVAWEYLNGTTWTPVTDGVTAFTSNVYYKATMTVASPTAIPYGTSVTYTDGGSLGATITRTGNTVTYMFMMP